MSSLLRPLKAPVTLRRDRTPARRTVVTTCQCGRVFATTDADQTGEQRCPCGGFAWPLRCGCGEVYDLTRWQTLPQRPPQSPNEPGGGWDVRTCERCDSTHYVPFSAIPAAYRVALPEWQRDHGV